MTTESVLNRVEAESLKRKEAILCAADTVKVSGVCYYVSSEGND